MIMRRAIILKRDIRVCIEFVPRLYFWLTPCIEFHYVLPKNPDYPKTFEKLSLRWIFWEIRIYFIKYVNH